MRNAKLFPLSLFSLALVSGCSSHKRAAPEASPTKTTSAADVVTPMHDVATLAARARPAVVNITTTQTLHARELLVNPYELFAPEERGRPREEVLRQHALGSGFIIDAQGHVVTNAHVVDDADEVKVKLDDEREYEATVKGRDRRLDLAVLELKGAPKDLPYAAVGDSAHLQVGEYVVAIGNPFGLGQTVTLGIVSAKGRAIGAGPYDEFLQTDASINPGNSGGPLFDMRGQVVGVSAAIHAGGQGLGFAIPSSALQDVLPQLLATGHVERGRIGVAIQTVDPSLARALGLPRPEGALIAELEKGGPAERAGVKPGDVVLAVDGTAVAHAQDLPRLVARNKPGANVKLDVVQGKQRRMIGVTLAPVDEDKAETRSAVPPVPSGRGGLGMALSDAPGAAGAVVDQVDPDGSARDALTPGDVVVEVNRKPVRGASDVAAAIKAAPASEPLLLTIKRMGHTRFVAIQRR